MTTGMTGVPCVCGKTHRFTPSAMAVLLLIAESGELHYVVSKGEIRYHCLFNAIRNLPEDDPRFSLYRGSIRFDIGEDTRNPRIVQSRIVGRGDIGIEPTTKPNAKHNGSEQGPAVPAPTP